MSRFLTTATLIALSLLTASANAQDLFSKEPLFNRKTEPAQGPKLTPQQLRRTLERAGYEIKNVYDDVVFEVATESEEWTFPVLVELSPDESILWATVILQEFPGDAGQHGDRLQRLMAVNGKYGNVFFKMDADSKMVMLSGSQANQELDADKVNDLLQLLTSVAVEHADVWGIESEQPVNNVQMLHGGWHYSEPERSMELNFRSNGRFTATFVESGQPESFYGNFSLNGDTIQLVSDDGEELMISIVELSGGSLTIDVNGTRFPMDRI